MTAYGSIPSAIEATKLGAFHYLEKPLEKDHLLLVINNAVDQVKLLQDNLMLKDQLFDKFHLDNIVGDHGSMQCPFRHREKGGAPRTPPSSSTGKVARAKSSSQRASTTTAPGSILPSLP